MSSLVVYVVYSTLWFLLLTQYTFQTKATTDICITSLNSNLIASYDLDTQSDPIYSTSDDLTYTRIYSNHTETDLQQRNIYNCSTDNDPFFTLIICNNPIFTNVWALYETNDTYNNNHSLIAFCSMDTSPSDPTACTEWMITNNSIDNTTLYPIFFTDNSFDIDDVCTENDTYNHTQEICFTSISTDDTNTHSQYLYGEWQLYGDSSDTYHNRRYYENVRLIDTIYASYVVWYDPKDTWYVITVVDNDTLDDMEVLNDYMGICNGTDDVTPINCSMWIIDDSVQAYFIDIDNYSECSYTVSKDTTDEEEICVSFDALLDGESDDFLLDIPYFYIINGIDANTFYVLLTNHVSNNRSVWRYSSSINFYVYYNDLLRFWIWTPNEPTSNTTIEDGNTTYFDLGFVFDSVYDSWCLMYDKNFPSDCTQFYYVSNDSDSSIVNVTSIIDDCKDTSSVEDWGAHIIAYLAISCLGCLLVTFIVGFVREHRQKLERRREREKESHRESMRLQKRISASPPAPHNLTFQMSLSLVKENTSSKIAFQPSKITLVSEDSGKKELKKPLITVTGPAPETLEVVSNDTMEEIELVLIDDKKKVVSDEDGNGDDQAEYEKP